ncbi:MAG: hypothetical protein KKD86_05740, partial [Bacteroidetes bacterium]|nr:hypothetical protein [Bacteroidota bacterium]
HLLSLVNELSVYTEFNSLTARKRAEELVLLKFGLADSAHIAFAEQSVDFFITCDEKLLRRCKKHHVNIKAMNPIEFCIEEELR